MNTKLLLSSSALLLGLIGIALTFAPDELLKLGAINTNALNQLVIQLLGALYFAFAMLNWTAKGALIGGIYNRPVAIANLSHFMIGALALSKLLLSPLAAPPVLWILGGIYVLYAVCFGVIFFRHPSDKSKTS